MNQTKPNIDLSYLDDDELELSNALERGEFEPTQNQAAFKKAVKQAAKNTIKKKALNIRLYERDISRIKKLAEKEGIGYQTLISSIVHRYAEGSLKRVD